MAGFSAASETVATVILAGTSLALLAVVMASSLWLGLGSALSVEYAYDERLMIGMAEGLPNVLAGGSYSAAYPRSSVALGYRLGGYIRIYVNSSAAPALEVPCYSLTAASFSGPRAAPGLLYGSGSPVVNDTRLLPRVRGYFANGSSVVELDACRLYAQVQSTQDRLGSFFYFNLMAVNLSPALSGRRGFVELHPSSPPSTYWFTWVYNLTVVVREPGGGEAVLGPRDIYPLYTGGPVTVSVTVVGVSAEVG